MQDNNIIKIKKSHYKHLTSYERAQIAILNSEDKTLTYIAKKLNRSKSTISREIKRNSILQQNYHYEFNLEYIPETAHKLAKKRKLKNKKLPHLKYNQEFFEQLYIEITKKYRIYSIESFIHYWKLLYPNDKIPSFKTVYRLIRSGLLKLKIYKLPRMSKLKPRINKNTKPKQNKKVLGTSIELRPQHINDRLEAGHFEIDTVKGKIGLNQANAISLVDRVTKFVYLIYLDKLNADNVNKELVKLFRKIGKKNFKSITSDNGSEFSKLTLLENNNFKVYFAHPYSSYERGTNENMNGQLREFLHKGCSMNGLKNKFANIQDCLNNRPRKILGFKTANQLHNEYLKNNKLI